jgi:TetR/AcrR family transcriptional regulator, ethionamide resistance regulator
MATTRSITAPSARGRRVRRATGDEREAAILETAERLMEDRPFAEISVDEIARGAGISRPTFYFYFPSKEAVLLTLLDRMVEEARTGRGDALETFAADPEESLRRGIAAVYRTFRAHRAAALAGADAAATSAAAREVWSDVMNGFVEEVAASLEVARAAGAVPDGLPARDLSTALNWMNERVFLSVFAGTEPTIAEEDLIDTLVVIWLGAIFGPASPPRA